VDYFVIQIQTGAETDILPQARQALDRLDLAPLDRTELLWPRRKLTIRRRGKNIPHEAPLFPGYLFVRCRVLDPRVVQALTRVSGVFRFLPDNRSPRALSNDDTKLINHFLSFGEVVRKSRVEFDEDNRIVVLDGPLKGLEGRITRVNRRRQRARIRLSLYENSFEIDLGYEVMARLPNNNGEK
jgi:transcriptional antiterminator NusG